jgi:Ca2+-binding EF-hand superfamily protein
MFLFSHSQLKKALQHLKGVSDEEIHEIFDAIDEDHTGMVHVNEFVAASLRAKDYLDEDHLRECFVKMDPLKTGFITVEGLKNLLGTCLKDETRVVQMIDEAQLFPHENADHQINFQEFSQFMRMDGNNTVINVRSKVKFPLTAASSPVGGQ